MLVSLPEGQCKLNLTPAFVNDFEMMCLNLQHFIKAQKTQKCNGVYALQHQSQPSTTPVRLNVRTDWRFSKPIHRHTVIDMIKPFEIT